MKQHFKDLIKRNRWIKWVPNALTLGNSLCGFAAILYTLQVYEKMMYRDGSDGIEKIFAFSACMILFAMVFDAFDGYAARLLNAASLHGIQMDSLADMVTFGVAPATLVAVMAHSMRPLAGNQFRLVWCLCAIYLGCAALRLAKYNVHAILEKKSSDKFSGLPSPGAAGAICSVTIFYALEQPQDGSAMVNLISFLPYYTAILGFLMVSTIPYQHFGKWLFSIPRNKKRMLIAFVVLVALCIEPAWTGVILINGYIIWGPIAWFLVKIGVFRNTEETRI